MDAELLAKTRQVRDQISALHDQDLMEADLVSIWPHLRYVWVQLYPPTEPILKQAESKGVAFAIQTVYETADQIIGAQEVAASLRSEKDDLEKMVGGLFESLKDYK